MEGQDTMNLHIYDRYESAGFLGIWEEEWRARATIASQAERYRTWLRMQGCTRDEAAVLAVRFLAANPPTGPHLLSPSRKPIIH
jgi:hypothetical protein